MARRKKKSKLRTTPVVMGYGRKPVYVELPPGFVRVWTDGYVRPGDLYLSVTSHDKTGEVLWKRISFDEILKAQSDSVECDRLTHFAAVVRHRETCDEDFGVPCGRCRVRPPIGRYKTFFGATVVIMTCNQCILEPGE